MRLRKQTDEFKEKRLEYQQKLEDDTQSQVFVLAKVIHKEVFDISDSFDIMAQVIKRQEQLLIEQDRRMRALEEKVAGRATEDTCSEVVINHGKFHVLETEGKSIISRHDSKFKYLIKKGEIVRTSNRNEILLG